MNKTQTQIGLAVREAVDLLLAMRCYSPDLPDATVFLSAPSGKTKKLRDALAFAKARPKLTLKDEGDLCVMLAEALLGDWPSNMISFARNFHELAHSKSPTKKMFSREEGVHLEEITPRPVGMATKD